jgi:hypothetical protein
MDEKVARNFAEMAEDDENDMVLLKITVENETGKHFCYLDRPEYANFPNEKEVLL